MNRDSETRWLTGCLGINGETRKAVIARAVHTHGAGNPIHRSAIDDSGKFDSAATVFKKLFGEQP